MTKKETIKFIVQMECNHAKDLHLRGAPLILQRGEFKKEILFSYII